MILVIGYVRIASEQVAALLPAARAQMAASRAEDGCHEYAYAEDLEEPGMIRVNERWRDYAALEAHFRAPHMATWRQALADVRVIERKVTAFEVTGERAL